MNRAVPYYRRVRDKHEGFGARTKLGLGVAKSPGPLHQILFFQQWCREDQLGCSNLQLRAIIVPMSLE